MADLTFESVCFVATDPSYCVALDAIEELKRGGRLPDDVPVVKVGNSGLRHRKEAEKSSKEVKKESSKEVKKESSKEVEKESSKEVKKGRSKEVEKGSSEKKEYTNKYSRYYDFSRTLGAVLRAFMLTATGLIKYYHPDIGDSEEDNLTRGENGFYVNGKTKEPEFRSQAQLISGNFDRLYPHILIEKKLKDAGLDKEVSFPGRMLIVDMENAKDSRVITEIHTINTTVRFTESEGTLGKVINCPHPCVEYTSERVGEGKDGEKLNLLKDMISRYPRIVREWEAKKEADSGAAQPEEQAVPGAAQPEDEEEEGEEVAQKFKDLNLKT
ncbi:hypothetical protein Bbelb_028590 [Branchiostoma belcheri]|nr:hypothetical protein Bbelb_028590 [Branchiostoma belcheri]